MIVVCGEALVDLTATDVDGEMAYMPRPGGSPHNVAVGLARLGVPCAFLGKISTDAFGEMLAANLVANGVDVGYVARSDLPSTLATIMLMDSDTGRVICVMDGSYITAMRTGAISGLATKLLARSDARVAGVLGTGVQARTQLWAMAAVRKLDKALCYSTNPREQQEQFAEELGRQLGIPVEVAENPGQVVESADILALATTSETPIVKWQWIRPGTHINGVGAHLPHARELDTKTVVRAKIVCDHIPACLAEAGDLRIPITEGALSAEDIYAELGELVTGKKIGRESDQEVTFFKSVGLSIQDIGTAHYVYEQAIQRNIGTEFQF